MLLEPIIGKTLNEIIQATLYANGKVEYAQQIAKCIYRNGAISFDGMNSIPKSIRKTLSSNHQIGHFYPIKTIESKDHTRRYLFLNNCEQQFESVYMPSPKRNTLCISTQSGCRMGCSFCLTGKIDFKGSLSAHDILNQYLSVPERSKINRIVLMGMGEPFDNYIEVKKAVEILTAEWGVAFGASNITLSTVGLLEPLKLFLDNPFCNLAISLNNPIGQERKDVMPIEKSNPIYEAVNLLKKHPIKKPLRLSFEYVALGGINIFERHAIAIAELLKGLKYHLNIIPWNSHEGSQFNSPTEIELNAFINCLNANGVLTAVRKSRGQDIGAACGQMAGREVDKFER